MVKAWKADEAGNLIFRKTANNFNQPMAKAARLTIAEVEEIVPVGELDPDAIHVPGAFVNRLVLATENEKRIENLTVSTESGDFKPAEPGTPAALRERIVYATMCRPFCLFVLIFISVSCFKISSHAWTKYARAHSHVTTRRTSLLHIDMHMHR